jgi:hypothetical protein
MLMFVQLVSFVRCFVAAAVVAYGNVFAPVVTAGVVVAIVAAAVVNTIDVTVYVVVVVGCSCINSY